MTIVCGDSHTATHGAFGALAFGIGTSEVEHVLATQTLPQARPKWMAVDIEGDLPAGVTAKDVILAIIGKIGTGGGIGHVIEYRGSTIRDLSMEGRMTVCNMSIEAGARGRARRARRHDVRLPRGSRPRATGRGVGRRRRRVAQPAQRRRRPLGPSGRARCDHAAPAGHVGHEPGPGHLDRRRRPIARRVRRRHGTRVGLEGAGVHGPGRRHGDARHRRRHRVHRVVHEQPHRGPARRRRRARRPARHRQAGDGRAGEPRRPGAGRGGRPRPRVHRRRSRLAPAGVLDVPGDEPGQAGARRAGGEHQQPQLRGAPGPRRAHPPRLPRRRRRHRRRRPLRHPGGTAADA